MTVNLELTEAEFRAFCEIHPELIDHYTADSSDRLKYVWDSPSFEAYQPTAEDGPRRPVDDPEGFLLDFEMNESDYAAMVATNLILLWDVPAEPARQYVITERTYLGAHWHRGDDIFEVARAAAAEMKHAQTA